MEHREEPPHDARRVGSGPSPARSGLIHTARSKWPAMPLQPGDARASARCGADRCRRAARAARTGCMAASPTTRTFQRSSRRPQQVAGRHRVGARHARASCRRGRRCSCGSSTAELAEAALLVERRQQLAHRLVVRVHRAADVHQQQQRARRSSAARGRPSRSRRRCGRSRRWSRRGRARSRAPVRVSWRRRCSATRIWRTSSATSVR